jgi:lysophospholipase L1-like esterase
VPLAWYRTRRGAPCDHPARPGNPSQKPPDYLHLTAKADYLHLTAKGYRLWADAMEPTLWRLLDEPKKKG